MKIKNSNLNRLIGGLEQIGQLDIADFQLNYYISRNMDKLSSLWKSYNKSLSALINEHVQMDKSGNPIAGEQYSFKTAKDKTDYIKKKTEIDEIETEMKLFKLKTSTLKDAKSIEVTNKDGTKTKKFLNGAILFMLNEIIIDDANILSDENSDESENNVPKKEAVAAN